MTRLADTAKEKWNVNRKTLGICLLSVFLWGMTAHAYAFLHSSFTHDSLREFNAAAFGNELKIQLGRVFVPAYRAVTRSALTLPWLIGLLALLYIGLAVFLTVKIFDIRSKPMIAVTAGIFTVNLTVIAAAATYIHDLDCDALALLLAVFAVYLLKRLDKGFLYGMVPVALSLGLYQSYISVSVTLLIFWLLLLLLEGGRFREVLVKGLKSAGMLIGGGLLYLLAVKTVCAVTGVALNSGTYNSLDNSLSLSLSEWVRLSAEGYTGAVREFLTPESVYPEKAVFAVHILICAIICAIALAWLISAGKKGKEKLLFLALAAILPLGMNVSYILAGGMSHDLMYYAIWLLYLLLLLLLRHMDKNQERLNGSVRRGVKAFSYALVIMVLWGNTQTANTLYLQKDLIAQANRSLFTRIVADMDDTDGYIPGETPVVFVGKPDLEPIPGFEDIFVTGSFDHALGASSITFYQAYFDYVMLDPAVMADTEVWDETRASPAAAAMPCYPEEGSVRMLDGVLVIKLSQG